MGWQWRAFATGFGRCGNGGLGASRFILGGLSRQRVGFIKQRASERIERKLPLHPQRQTIDGEPEFDRLAVQINPTLGIGPHHDASSLKNVASHVAEGASGRRNVMPPGSDSSQPPAPEIRTAANAVGIEDDTAVGIEDDTADFFRRAA